MFLVFGWLEGDAQGGVNDLLKTCDTEQEALAFVERLRHTDPSWETHITDDALEILHESDELTNVLAALPAPIAN